MLILSGAQRLSGSVENQPLYLNDLSPSLELSPRFSFFSPQGGAGYDCGGTFP
jgi:hypothetical protein